MNFFQSSSHSIAITELFNKSLLGMTEKNLIKLNGKKEIKVTQLGRATLKGMIDLDQSKALYDDLHLAQESLPLETNLHLMYLVTPYDAVGSVFPIASTYFKVMPRKKYVIYFP